MRGRKRLLESVHIYLPPGLLRQILARLPPKTLMQFRCVCKDWRSLIDDFDFISLHLNLYRNYHPKAQLFTIEAARGESLKFKFQLRQIADNKLPKIAELFEYSSVNCDSSLINGLSLLSDIGCLILFNPSIRKFLALPSCPIRYGALGCSCLLGYAPSNDDYKVVAIGERFDAEAFDMMEMNERFDATAFDKAVAIYSLRDHRWREYTMQVRNWVFHSSPWDRGAVYVQGAVYWMPRQSRENAEDTELLSFDFNFEEFRYVKLPVVEDGMFIFLFVFGGSLAVFGISSVRSCIWVLEKNAGNDSNESWRRCWNRDTSSDVYELFKDFSSRPYKIIYIEDTGTMLLVRLRTDRKLVAYNIRSNQIQKLAEKIPIAFVDTYVESMVLHKGYEDAGQQYNFF